VNRQQSHIATFIGLGIAVVGFLAIGVAWDGAAGENWVPAQFPYLISGGLAGLGLIIVGVTVVIIQTMRSSAAERTAELERLAARVEELHKHLAPADDYDPAASGEFRPRPRSDSNGEAPTEQIPAASGTSGWERPE
jgi:hypothetical protein